MPGSHELPVARRLRYVRERVTRVLIPLVPGTLLLVTPKVYLERRPNGQFTGCLWSFYPRFFDGIYPRGDLSRYLTRRAFGLGRA